MAKPIPKDLTRKERSELIALRRYARSRGVSIKTIKGTSNVAVKRKGQKTYYSQLRSNTGVSNKIRIKASSRIAKRRSKARKK